MTTRPLLGRALVVLPMQREWPSATLTVPYDEAVARPVAQAEFERSQREGAREDPLWVTGDEKIRPPAKALTVPDGKGPIPRNTVPFP